MFKKGFVGLMVFAMILTMVGAVTVPARAASDGDLIKMAGNSAVYYLNGGKRYVFPNQKTYNTWYADFSKVVTISESEMVGYPLGGNVTYRPGTRLVKITTVPTVYAVEPGGALRSIVSEANALALYGSNWNKMIDDVPDAFFVNYSVGAALTEGVYPTGTLVKASGSSTVYYIDGTTKRPVATGTAFEANGFSWANVLTASSLSGYTDGTSITGKETFSTVAGSGTTTGPAAGGTVTVALASLPLLRYHFDTTKAQVNGSFCDRILQLQLMALGYFEIQENWYFCDTDLRPCISMRATQNCMRAVPCLPVTRLSPAAVVYSL